MSLGRTLARYFVGVVVLAVVIVAGLVLRIVQFAHAGEPHAADAIVVMGAAQYNGSPSPVFRARLDHAAALYRDGKAAHIVTVGGGQEGDRTTEGAAGEHYLAGTGIETDALTAVGVGNDTLVSLRAAARVAREHHWHSVVLVSDPWHLARCRIIAKDLGLAVQVSPVTSGPATDPSVEMRYIGRELEGTLFYRLTGGSSGAGHPVI
jgi:uncharacterized SAM-binding protein YcdF (DUF218 family)